MTANTRSDSALVFAAGAAAAAMIAAHVAGRAARDTLFLVNHPVEALPIMAATAAVVSLLALLGVGRLMARFSPARIVPLAFVLNGLLFVVGYTFAELRPRLTSAGLYLQLAVFGPLLVSGFWSLVNEVFDPHTARRRIARIGLGATVGGVAGGLIAQQTAGSLGAARLLVVLCGLSLLAAVGVRALARRSSTAPKPGGSETSSALRVLAERPYVRNLGLFVALVALGSALVEYVLRVEAVAAHANEAELLSFFALFYTGTSVISFVVQAAFGSLSLRRLGLAGSVALLPGTIALGGLVSFALPALWRAVFLRGADMVLQNSIYRSGYELFYTPLSPADKRATKSTIDIGFDRVGQVLGSGVILLVAQLAAGVETLWLVGCAIVVAATGLVMTVQLNRGYVSALGRSLQSSAIEIEGDALLDNTTRSVWESSVSLSRTRILEAIASSESWKGGELLTPSPSPEPVQDELLEAIADLRSGDTERVRHQLRQTPLDRRLVGHVIPLLRQDGLLPDVLPALREVAPEVTGQLLDALLDVEEDFAVRRRLPRVLQVCRDQRAADGLLRVLTDTRFNVRYHAARALLSIVSAAPQVRVEPGEVFAIARREIEAGRHVWDHDRLIDADDASGPFDQIVRERTSRSLEHVFTILALALDAEPLQLAFKALESDERAVRGTALEYLENVLPAEIRDSLLPVLGGRPAARPSHRSREQIVAELNRSVALDRAELRRKLRESEH